MENLDLIWEASVDEITVGYKESKEAYVCLFCGKVFKKGKIYQVEKELYDAYGAIRNHMISTHDCAATYFLKGKSTVIGISEIQQQILRLMAEGKEDRSIAKDLGIAHSTVRNHRFKLREKEKQAKLYLAMMRSLEEKISRKIKVSDMGVLEEVHLSANMIDDRYSITDLEREKTIQTYMDKEGCIKQFPSKEKKKIILLREIMKQFKANYEYQEKEVNQILKRFYEDYPTIRRALIEYGFLERSDDCGIYRVK